MATKAELINHVSLHLGVTKKEATSFVEAFEAHTKASLAEKGEALVPGVGKLKVKDRAARTGRNPQTGEALQIPAGKVVRLAPTKGIKAHIHGHHGHKTD